MLGSLNHPNVLRFYGAVVQAREDPAVIGIMTEFMRGGSLAQFLRCALPPCCCSAGAGLLPHDLRHMLTTAKHSRGVMSCDGQQYHTRGARISA